MIGADGVGHQLLGLFQYALGLFDGAGMRHTVAESV